MSIHHYKYLEKKQIIKKLKNYYKILTLFIGLTVLITLKIRMK